jgi:hypothetical protein
VLASARQGATVKELRGATGMTRERLETPTHLLAAAAGSPFSARVTSSSWSVR